MSGDRDAARPGQFTTLNPGRPPCRWKDLRLGYTTTQGLPELREEIAKVHFTKVDADDMVLDAPGDAMFVAMTALLSAGDHVVCTLPGYQSLYETARSLGCELSFWTPVAGYAIAAYYSRILDAEVGFAWACSGSAEGTIGIDSLDPCRQLINARPIPTETSLAACGLTRLTWPSLSAQTRD